MPAIEGDWRNWTTRNWNEALFEHYFHDSDGHDRPVQRIPITREELSKVVSDPEADKPARQKESAPPSFRWAGKEFD